MAIIRNTAGQGVYVRAIDSTGAAITTGVTCQVSQDGGTESAATTGASHVGGALWWQPLSQAETDGGTLAVRPDATDIVPDPVGIVTYEAMRGTDGAALASDWTSTRANYVDKLNVTGTLAHDNAASTYQATGFSTHSASDVWSVTTRTLSAAGVQAIWDAATSALTTVGSIGKLLVDMLNVAVGTRSSHPDPTSGLQTYGDSNWATATGFAVPGDAMTLTAAERTAIKDALEAVGGKLDTAYRGRSRIREETDGWYWDIIDGNGDVVVSLELHEITSDVPAFDRTGAEPNV